MRGLGHKVEIWKPGYVWPAFPFQNLQCFRPTLFVEVVEK